MKSPVICISICAALACALTNVPAAQPEAGAREQIDGEWFRILTDSSPRSSFSNLTVPWRNANMAHATFSDPGKPGTLKITDDFGRIEIEGVDRSEVSVTSPVALKKNGMPDDNASHRPDADDSFELVEKDNVISLNISRANERRSYSIIFKIQVPRNTNIIIDNSSMSSTSSVAIANLDGDVDINMGGVVTLINTTGAITAVTNSGSIIAKPGKAPEKPIMLINNYGAIDLALPVETTATVRLRTGYGTIRTNFPEAALKTAFKDPVSKNDFDDKVRAYQERRAAEAAKRRQEIGGGSGAQSESDRLEAIRAEVARRRQTRDSSDDRQSASERLESIVAEIAKRKPSGEIDGELNGGGVEIGLGSEGGTITLRQKK